MSGLDALLASLAPEPDGEAQQVVIDGLLLRGDDETFRLVCGSVCLTFPRADVIAVVKSERPADGSYAPAVRLRLRRPARLLAVEPSSAFASLVVDDARPFSICSRPRAAWAPDSTVFTEQQSNFLCAAGLGEASSS